MTTVSAVATTGIYCRPDCSARPDPANVTIYGSAAAAEAAGYRACLRCRPYRLDPPVTWEGPELVCRAVQLVLAGALDGGTEAGLAAAVGLSGRHLRRHFLDHLGVTPGQLARSRRAHFARRLLDDTDLDVTAVAFAAGFGSVRQFNRTMDEVFRATPTELRARRRRADRLVADGGLTVRLGFTSPYDWPAMLAYLADRAIPGVEHVEGDGYRRTVAVAGHPGMIEVTPGGPDHLLLRAHLPHWEGLVHVVARVRRLLALDVDPAGAARALVDDTLIGDAVRTEPGVRVPGTWDPYETGVRAILGQQVSVAGANTLAARLVTRWGEPVAGLAPVGLTHLFPTPEALASGPLDDLGLTAARAAAVAAFAAAVRDGAVRLDHSRPLEELVASIAALPGLGPWTAHYLALRLGERDAFPAGDLGLRRGAARLAGRSVTGTQLGALAERWRPWRATAAVHLWRAAPGPPARADGGGARPPGQRPSTSAPTPTG